MGDPVQFLVTLDGSCYLDIEDIWPDGDAPENPTTEDVAAVMRGCGSKLSVLDDWSLVHELGVEVHAKGQPRIEVWQ